MTAAVVNENAHNQCDCFNKCKLITAVHIKAKCIRKYALRAKLRERPVRAYILFLRNTSHTRLDKIVSVRFSGSI